MVVLTIVTQWNRETIYFEDTLPEAKYARLLSCSFFNSWHNLALLAECFLKEPTMWLHHCLKGITMSRALQKNCNPVLNITRKKENWS